MPAPAKPRRRWWRAVFAFVALVFIVLAGAWLYFDYAAKKAWDEAEAELDRSDPRWRLLEIGTDWPPIADDENGALVIVAIAPKLERAGLFDAAGKFQPAFEKLPATARLNDQQMDLIKTELAKLPEFADVKRKLIKTPRGRFPIKFADDWLGTLINERQLTRQFAEALKCEAFMLAETKQYDEALASCAVMLDIADMLAPEWSLIEYLIRRNHQTHAVYALKRILAQGEPSSDALRLIQASVARGINDKGLLHAMRGERAGLHHLMTNIRNSKVKDLRMNWQSHEKFRHSGWMYEQFPSTLAPHAPEALRFMTEAVEIAKLPMHERKPKLDEWHAKARGTTNPVIFLLCPAFDQVNRADVANQALLRSAVVAMASERYRRTHKDCPTSLEDLVKAKLLDAVPVDPIDNQPLRFRRTNDGIVIYSIGTDGIDNQGHIDHENWNAKGVDLGFRLWNPGARRQLPMPPVVENEEK
jgi:tetratricopeptide (TPR) repeat protein